MDDFRCLACLVSWALALFQLFGCNTKKEVVYYIDRSYITTRMCVAPNSPWSDRQHVIGRARRSDDDVATLSSCRARFLPLLRNEENRTFNSLTPSV